VERVVFVEVLDRRGKVRDRTRVDSFPATIGRAYSNDVIVVDRYVSPTHVAIRETEDGGLVIEDAGSVNGVHLPGRSEPVDVIPLESGLRLRLGETVVRFVTAAHLVAPAERLPRGDSGLLEALKSPGLALSLLAFTLLVFTADTYLATYYDFSGAAVLGPAVIGIVVLSFWAGIWAFANRLLTHRFDFLRHLAVACLASVGSMFLWALSEYAEFFFSSASLSMALGALTQTSLAALLLYGHLSIIPASSPHRRRRWAFGVTAVAMGLTGLLTLAGKKDYSSDVVITVPLKSLGTTWVPTISTEEFLNRSQRTRTWVDEAINDPP
jgi:hypothetical protein